MLLWMTFAALKCYTRHNSTYEVPNFVGEHIDDVMDSKSKFRFVVNDSIYEKTKRPGEIINQDPQPLSRAKKNRQIYLRINTHAVPLTVLRGGFYGKETAIAISDLESDGFIVKVTEVFGIPPGTVSKVKLDGRVIEDSRKANDEGISVKMGTEIELVVNSESNGSYTDIPDLSCLTYSEAVFALQGGHNLSMGSVISDATVYDTLTAFVAAQFPPYEPGKGIPVGSQIDIRLTQNKPPSCGSDWDEPINPGGGGDPDSNPTPTPPGGNNNPTIIDDSDDSDGF